MTNLLLFDVLSEHMQVCASALMAQYAAQLYPTTPSCMHPGNISRDDGLSCVSALNVNDIGEWFYPDGEEVTLSPGSVFSSLSRVRHVVLLRGEADFTSDAEGVYTCRIPDESGVQRTLYVGIYQTSTYESSSEQLCRQR